MTLYYYNVKVRGYKSIKTIAQDSPDAKTRVSELHGIPITQIAKVKRGEALNLLELPND